MLIIGHLFTSRYFFHLTSLLPTPLWGPDLTQWYRFRIPFRPRSSLNLSVFPEPLYPTSPSTSLGPPTTTVVHPSVSCRIVSVVIVPFHLLSTVQVEPRITQTPRSLCKLTSKYHPKVPRPGVLCTDPNCMSEPPVFTRLLWTFYLLFKLLKRLVLLLFLY